MVKDVRRAIARGGLTASGWCVAEGFHLVEEALRGLEVRAVLAAESTELRGLRVGAVKVTRFPDALFQTMSATETSQGVIALVQPRAWTLDQLFTETPLVVMLDGIQDPGNAGAIVRSAEAFGATGAIFLKGGASPFHPKTLRASAGSLFRLPFVHGVEPGAATRPGVARFAADPGAKLTLREADFTAPSVLIVGSEAHGVRGSLRADATGVRIPTRGVESLNAAVAAAVILYEAGRQRFQ
jgi:TrmH family RNA methyltransferase